MSHQLFTMIRSTLLVLVALIISSNALSAQQDSVAPNSPDLSYVAYGNYQGYGILSFGFQYDLTAGEPEGFRVYLGTEDNGTITYQLLYTVDDTTQYRRDSIRYFSYTAPNLDPGTYHIYVTAYNEFGESSPSNDQTFIVEEQPPMLTFLSPNVVTAVANQPFTYTPLAVSSDSSQVMYRINWTSDASITIDEQTGDIIWTPIQLGVCYFSLEAYLADDPSVSELLWVTINVRNCQTPGIIVCNVVDEQNNPVESFVATAYSNVFTTTDTITYNGKAYYGTFYNRSNSVEIPIVNEGYYWLLFEGYDFESVWYENSRTFENADSIYVGCGDTIQITVVVRPKTTITFTNNPNTGAVVNQLYTYNPAAVASDGSEVRYRLYDNNSLNITIDPLTGELSWTPTEIGWFYFDVVAYLANDSTIFNTKSVYVEVRNCERQGILIFNVVDENNDPVESYYSTIYTNVITNRDTVLYPLDVAYYVNGRVSGDGNTYIQIGNADWYWIELQGKDFETQWYANSTTIENADSIYVGCGDTVRITMVVHPYEVPEYFTVNGSVLDATNNNPVPYALVEFYGTAINSDNKIQLSAYADPITGQYSVSLPENYEYLAYCFVLDTMGMSTQYLPQYYYLAADPTTAERFVLTGDKDNVNFLLNPRPNYTNSISGIVQNVSSTPLQYVYVVAYLVGTDQDNQDKLYIGRVDCSEADGTFYFDNLIPGEYVIFAFPMDRETYFPGYYLLNAPVVMSWTEGTRITVTEDNNSGPFTVILVPRPINGYKGGFEGYVKQSKKGLKAGSTLGDGTAIAGANVFATDMSGNKLSFGQSDVTGKFEVSDLKKGKYNLFTDKVGFESQPVTIELTDDNKIISTDLEMIEAVISDVEESTTSSTQAIAYPNPAADQATLFFTTNYKGNVNISMFNSIGDVVLTNQTTSEYGLNKYTLNLSNIQNGMYFVKIENGNDVQMIPLVVKR